MDDLIFVTLDDTLRKLESVSAASKEASNRLERLTTVLIVLTVVIALLTAVLAAAQLGLI